MFGPLLKLLLTLDFLAPSMHMNVNGSWAIKTYTGVLISIACLGLSMYASTLQIIDFFDTTNPLIAQELKLNTVYPEVDMVANHHVPVMFAFRGVTDVMKFEEVSSYFTFRYATWIYSKPENASHGAFGLEITELPFMPCRDLISKGLLNPKDYVGLGGYLDMLPDHGICIDPNDFNLTVTGANADRYSKFVNLEMFPCSLPDGIGCKTKEEVNTVWIQLIKPAIGLNLGDQDNPLRRSINSDDFYALNTDINQNYLQQLIKNTIFDDKGFLIPIKEKVNFTTYDPPLFTNAWRDTSQTVVTREQILSGEAVGYFSYLWGSGMKYNLIRRNYNSFLDYLGNIGGINSILMATCFGLYYFWHYRQEKFAMVHAIYGLKKTRSNCCRKKRVHPNKTESHDLQKKKV